MSSVLRRTSPSPNHSKHANEEYLYPSGKRAGPPSAPFFPVSVAPSSASAVGGDAFPPSRGVPLLLRGKQFHLTQRGLKETSGFWYISRLPKRNARELEAAKLRQWELETEQAPSDEFCFWKLATKGGVQAVTTPEALFPPAKKDEDQGGEGDRQELEQLLRETALTESDSKQQDEEQDLVTETSRMGNSPTMKRPSTTKALDGKVIKQMKQRHIALQHLQPKTLSPDSTTDDKQNAKNSQKTKSKTSSEAPTAAAATAANQVVNNSCTTLGERKQGETRAAYRIGLKSKFTAGDTNRRRKMNRLVAPPEGTLTALGWGWGGEFRLGTGRDGYEIWPRPVHPHFQRKQLVDLAVGKRHTIFVSDDGLMFSVGEGLSWQLGTTSQFVNHPERQAVQRLPRQVHPSGNLKAGKDYWVAQAAAGDTFSVSREANWEDAARAIEGYFWMKESVKTLLEQSPSSKVLKELWAHILEEERTLRRRFQGRLLSWGSGERGQLGLGEDVVDRRTPRVIRALAGMPIRSVSAGAAHTLCVTLDGQVFSWGRGRDGRLGHGDYKDRWEPCRVEGLVSEPVALIAAGMAHSMAVSLPQSVYIWGRGAHGRLGTGDNKCRHEPVRLKTWPPGFPGCVIKDIALGGAHSIVLAHRTAPTTLANPWGADSLAYAWGYGYCGQLGLGRRVGEVRTPSKIAFDMKELITSVTAGKSFSLATNIQGQLFAWGRGWSGQLGLGIEKDSRVAPARANFPGAGRHLVVKLSAGERHASALTVSCFPPPHGWDKDKQWEKVVKSHVGMKKWESELLRLWRCPRRPFWTRRGPNPEPLFMCTTCGVSCLCRKCARLCHEGHDILPCSRKLRVLCECGLRPFEWGTGGGDGGNHRYGTNGKNYPCSSSRHEGRMAATTKANESGHGLHSGGEGGRAGSQILALNAPPTCRLLVSVEDEDDGGDTAEWLQHNAVEVQRHVRGWLGGRLARGRAEEKRRRRREAMEAVWYVSVLGAMHKSIARFEKGEERERNREGMAAADLESHFYRYYSKLQPVIMALNQQREVLNEISTREGVTFETLASTLDPRVRRGLAPPQTITLWSRRAVRQLQRQFPPKQRLDERKLVRITAKLPTGGDLPKRSSSPATASVGGAGAGEGGNFWKGGGRGEDGGEGGEGKSTGGSGEKSFCGEAAGTGRLGGVADPDVDVLLRSSQPLRKRRTVDIAAPERLYQRVTGMRYSQMQRLSSRRRASFSEGDFAARVDKNISSEDRNWAKIMGRYWMGVDSSLGATQYLQIGDRKSNKLTDPQQLRWRRGARSMHRFLQTFGPGSIDPDVMSVKERRRACRAHSLCAPERVYAATVTWETRHKKLQGLLRAAARRGYPASGDSMKWTARAEKWGGLAPPPRTTAIAAESLRKSGQRIVMRAVRRGWDLRPYSSQFRPGSGGNDQNCGVSVKPGSAEEAAAAISAAGPWSAYEDGEGNTYYVNDFTGESAWEIPPPATPTALMPLIGNGNEATGTATTWGIVTTAAGNGEDAGWWNGESGDGDRGELGDGWGTGASYDAAGAVVSNPFYDYQWPQAGQIEVEAAGYSQHGQWEAAAATGWELDQERGYEGNDGAEGWTQEWDEASQSYYWYNSLTGESRS